MTVVNLRDYPGQVLPDGVARVDRATRYGNPFKIDKRHGQTREVVIERYRAWLSKVLENDPDWLEPLRGKDLACHCAPLACHGDVLDEFLKKGG